MSYKVELDLPNYETKSDIKRQKVSLQQHSQKN